MGGCRRCTPAVKKQCSAPPPSLATERRRCLLHRPASTPFPLELFCRSPLDPQPTTTTVHHGVGKHATQGVLSDVF